MHELQCVVEWTEVYDFLVFMSRGLSHKTLFSKQSWGGGGGPSGKEFWPSHVPPDLGEPGSIVGPSYFGWKCWCSTPSKRFREALNKPFLPPERGTNFEIKLLMGLGTFRG